MIIKILGTGCAKCKKLEDNAREAASELAREISIEKVTELDAIMDYGVMITPALVIDETVVSSGKVLSAKEIIALINKGE